MSRTIRLHELSTYFPARQNTQTISTRYSESAHVGSDLQNRLVNFALGLGAMSARIDFSGRNPVLLVLTTARKEIRTELTGTSRDWHVALDEFDELYDEHELAGLYRFLGVHQLRSILLRREKKELPTRHYNFRRLAA